VSVRHLYLHVPFCARRCSYCDFSIAVRRVVPWRSYADAVRRECEVRQVQSQAGLLSTLYLGGGTPSRLGADGVSAVFEALQEFVTWATDAEVTLEANPEDITVAAVRAWRAAGVNRLSIGTQSFDDGVLQWMHRVHDAEAARQAVETARDGGIESLSLDLIFAAPEGLARDWDHDLDEALALRPDHLSLYGLTIEPHTPLGRWQARGTVTEADEGRFEAEFLRAHERLSAQGYAHYEVSNYALPGREAVHNGAYWTGAPYLGLGPSAHGYDGHHRRANISAFAQWESSLIDGHDPIGEVETLTAENRLAESVYLGLRTSAGLAISDADEAHIQPWVAAGWVRVTGHGATLRVACTPAGWLRLDALAADLTAFRSHS
jgi:oxygen-independent coproporphyrinogen-3 oxidase